MGRVAVMEVSRGIAEAVKACRPNVISAYPITPQTHIIEELAKMIAAGELKAEYIRADSEFAAASIVYGASAAGVRAYTASSSQGLLLMGEVLWNMAGTRLPVVLTGANRVLSAPISIQCDHQDTLSFRDAGVIQLYVEDGQEAVDMHIQAFKLAENPEILLPTIVCVEGWVLTHTYEPLELLDEQIVDEFLPPYTPTQYLTPEKPLTYGSYVDDDLLMEIKYMMHNAMRCAEKSLNKISEEFGEISGRYYGGAVEEYRLDNAEICLLAMGSTVGVMKDAVDELRKEGVKVGLLKIRMYRPFPMEEVVKAVKDVECVAIIDRNISLGAGGALAADVKAAVYNSKVKPLISSFIAGIGGREITKDTIRRIVTKAQNAIKSREVEEVSEWLDLNPDVKGE